MISIITPVRAKDQQAVQWLHEAVASVHGQSSNDWEMIVVNDHSPADISAVQAAWPRVRWLEAEGEGVSAARNQAARESWTGLLLPLDADDKLSANAVQAFLAAWHGEGILYSDVVMFGQDHAKAYLATEYSFETLLKATFMTIGCLHKKADWERAGGWRLDMTAGLEDWEYWIALGERGVCGTHLAEPLYWYRRHKNGRLAWLKANRENWNRAYAAMRDLHKESYAGRFTDMCCGGGRVKGARAPLRGTAVARAPAPSAESTKILYTGPRKGNFQIVGAVSRTKYVVPGSGNLVQTVDGKQAVNKADLQWFRSIARGKDYVQVEEPAAAAPVAKPVVAESPAWKPEVMEPVPIPVAAPGVAEAAVPARRGRKRATDERVLG